MKARFYRTCAYLTVSGYLACPSEVQNSLIVLTSTWLTLGISIVLTTAAVYY